MGDAFTDLNRGMTRTVVARKVRKSSPNGTSDPSPSRLLHGLPLPRLEDRQGLAAGLPPRRKATLSLRMPCAVEEAAAELWSCGAVPRMLAIPRLKAHVC